MPRSCLLTAHSLAAGVRALFERIDEMRADASVVFVNLALLRVVVVQRAQRLGLHPNPFRLVEAVVCDVTTQLHGDCNLLQVMQKQLPHVQAPQQAHWRPKHAQTNKKEHYPAAQCSRHLSRRFAWTISDSFKAHVFE